MPNNDKVAIADQATITREQARTFFNMGRDRFNRRWEAYYQDNITNVVTEGGLRLLLTDVVKMAYPKANATQVLDIAFKYSLYLADKRVDAKHKRTMAKNEANDGRE